MVERKECSQSNFLLRFVQVPDFADLLGQLLLNFKKWWINRELCEWTKLDYVCKSMRPILKAVRERYFFPYAMSPTFLSVLQKRFKNVQHLEISNIWTMSFSNLRTIMSNEHLILTMNDIYGWNCPLLENLVMPQTMVFWSDVLYALSIRCPKLKKLNLQLLSPDYFQISGFMNLTKLILYIEANTRGAIKLHLSNMPSLQKVYIDGKLDLLEFGNNVDKIHIFQSLTSITCLKFVFFEPLPLLTQLDLGNWSTHIDLQSVKWDILTSLTFTLNDLSRKAFYQLRNIEDLEIHFPSQYEAKIDCQLFWNQLHNIKTLTLTNVTNFILSDFVKTANCKQSLVKLFLLWEQPEVVVNTEVLACFSNLQETNYRF